MCCVQSILLLCSKHFRCPVVEVLPSAVPHGMLKAGPHLCITSCDLPLPASHFSNLANFFPEDGDSVFL